MQKDDHHRPSSYYPYAYHNATPTADEIKATEELLEYIEQNGIYDTEEAAARRTRVINRLWAMLRAWAVSIGTAKGVPDEQLAEGGGIQIQVYGSTRLEVHNYSSDMDLLCIAPEFLQKSDFFSSFCDTLSACPDVDNLLSIPEAYTPVIKFVMMGISIDLVFTSLQLPRLNVPIDALDLRCLRGLDEQGVRSLNGVRVAEWLCKLVPNIQTYRVALRVIKHWAKQRGIYSNVLGFLGGINYAILVAMICQQYQNATPYVLIQQFFAIYSVWPWPTPVILRRFEDLLFKDSDGRYHPVWNPISNFKDSLHIMPIITPAYPSMNSAYNVALPQFRAIQEELIRGTTFFQRHQPGSSFPWSNLFESGTDEFFSKYPRYIEIDVTAPNAIDHRKWFGWVESRVRLFILALEQPPAIFCHPTANCHHRQPNHNSNNINSTNNPPNGASSPSPLSISTESTENGITTVEESQTDSQTAVSANIVTPVVSSQDPAALVTPKKLVADFHHRTDVYISSFFIALSFGQEQHRVNLQPQINDLKDKVEKWANKKPDMNLHIQIFDNESIPPWVFKVKAEPSGMESCTPNINRGHPHLNGTPLRPAGVGSASMDVHHSPTRSSSSHRHHNNRHHDVDEHHGRLVSNHHHNPGRTESQSFQSCTISYEMPEEEEHGIPVAGSRSTDSVISHSEGVNHPSGVASNPTPHLTSPSTNDKPHTPLAAGGTPRSNRSGSSNHSAFDTYRDVLGTAGVVGEHNNGHNNHAHYFQTNPNTSYKQVNSPKNYNRNKIPQSPKSPNYYKNNNNNNNSNRAAPNIDHFPAMSSSHSNGQGRGPRGNGNGHSQYNNNNNGRGGEANNATRRPSSSTFSSSSTELENILPAAPATSNNLPAAVVPATNPPLAPTTAPSSTNTNGIAQQPLIEPPLTFGALLPSTAPIANPVDATVTMRTSPIQTLPYHNPPSLEEASPSARVTPKRSRNEISGAEVNRF